MGFLVNLTRLWLQVHAVLLPAPTNVAFRLFFGIFTWICTNRINFWLIKLLGIAYVQGFLVARDRKPFRLFLVKREWIERMLELLRNIWRQEKVQPGHRRPWDCKISSWLYSLLSRNYWPPTSTSSACLLSSISMFANFLMAASLSFNFCLDITFA